VDLDEQGAVPHPLSLLSLLSFHHPLMHARALSCRQERHRSSSGHKAIQVPPPVVAGRCAMCHWRWGEAASVHPLHFHHHHHHHLSRLPGRSGEESACDAVHRGCGICRMCV
jgi:hypothetical protein